MQECQQPKILSVKSCDTSADSESEFDEIATAKEKKTSGSDIPERGSAEDVWLARGLARPVRGLVQAAPNHAPGMPVQPVHTCSVARM